MKITTTDGRQDRRLARDYESIGDAAEALRAMMGWASLRISSAYAVGDGHTYAVSAYETSEERDADEQGAFAPQIVGVPSDTPASWWG